MIRGDMVVAVHVSEDDLREARFLLGVDDAGPSFNQTQGAAYTLAALWVRSAVHQLAVSLGEVKVLRRALREAEGSQA